MTHDTATSIDRRTALKALGSGTLVGLAGCNGTSTSTTPSGTSPTSTTTATGPFTSISVQETTLVVKVDASADVDHVNLVKPNGSLFGKRSLAAGTHRVSFDIGTAYSPGTYKVIAVTGDQTIGSTTQELRPDLRILQMGIGQKHPDQMWNDTSKSISGEAFITVQNRGSGPSGVTKLLFFDDVPLPSTKNGTDYVNNSDVSGIYDPGTDSTTPKVVIPPGEQRTVYSATSPFGFAPGGAVTCTDHEQQGKFKLVLRTSLGDSLSTTYNVTYSASQQVNNCSINISEA